MTTSNDTSSNKITKRDLKSVFFRSLTMEYSWNYERQQHMGYCFSMLPIIRRVYKDKDDQVAAAKRHMEFFNTTPYVSTLILGISAAMEEANANEEDFDESSINSVKAALMSPLAGIGDLIVTATSMHSRNNRAGILIGKGETPEQAVKEVGMVVEGMNALPAALELAAKYQVEMPIVQTVNAVVNKGMSAAEAVRSLMDRDPKNELSQSYEK